MNVYVFDCDGTMYADRNARQQFTTLLQEFAHKRLRLDPDQLAELLRVLQQKYDARHSTAHLFSREFGIPLEETDEATYGQIDLAASGAALDPALARHLATLGDSRYLWTNSPKMYGARVLQVLGVSDLFQGIFGRDETAPYAKPHKGAYDHVVKLLPPGARVTFTDDLVENHREAKNLGWTTVLLRRTKNVISDPAVDRTIARLTDL